MQGKLKCKRLESRCPHEHHTQASESQSCTVLSASALTSRVKTKKLRFDWKVFESKGNELTLFPSITRSVMAFIARDTNPIISFSVGRFSLIEIIIVDILHR